MIFEHARFEIWNPLQHPYKHTLADFSYSNPALPFATNIEGALNWILAVLYPNTKPAVATPAALPLVGNTLNDYRVVLDDGDTKAASYRWEQREGEVSPSWHKVMDMDWSTDSILSNFLQVTQDLYVVQKGKQDLDSSGAVITGTFAGQSIWGGTVAGQNLTLRANSGDGTGAGTGYVQTTDNFRPTANNTLDFGTSSEKWKTGYFGTSALISTLTLSGGTITDSSGSISFDNENVTTTGNITGAVGYFSGTVEVGPLAGNALILGPGSITDESGAISFGNENLTTSGTLQSGVHTVTNGTDTVVFSPNVGGKGQITSSLGTLSFDNENLETTGNITGGVLTGDQLNIDNLRLDGNTLSSLNANGNIILLPNGTGIVDVQKAMQTLGQTITGVVTVTGQINADNLRLDGNTLSSTNVNGGILLLPNGTGTVEVGGILAPDTDMAYDIGETAKRFDILFLGGKLSDGTLDMDMSTLVTFRDANVGVGSGYSLFWNGTKWVASLPDSEVDHGTITGLLDDDHTQYALLAGRSGGQTLIGGTAASNNLNLSSTSHATKGKIILDSITEPLTDATYSGGWTGIDLGSSAKFFRDLYMKGEAKNFRFENFTFATLPAFNANNTGRVMYATDTKKAYVDTGVSIAPLGVSKYLADTVWNGTDTTKDVTVSADISDARNAIWALHDNTNDFDRIYCSLKAISATQVRITVSPALPAGSYRLIGLE